MRNTIGNAFPQLIEACEAPVMDTSSAALLCLSGLVREQGFKTVLSGEGADEGLAGYPWFKTNRIMSLLDHGEFRPSNIIRRMVGKVTGRDESWAEASRHQSLIGGAPAMSDFYGLLKKGRRIFYSDTMWDEIDGHLPYEDLKLDLDKMKRWDPLNQSLYFGYKTILPGLLMNQKGERLTDYLNRVKSLKRQLCTSIALQLAETIAALVDYPRLLSAIELDDFAVSLDQGQFLKVRLTDFGFEREETPKGDMQLALQWVRAVGAIHQRIPDGRGVPTTLAEMGRTNDHGNVFNGLLKRIEHQSGAQAARTLKGLKPHVLSASGLSESALNYLDPEFRSINRQSDAPVGPLQTLIMEGDEYKETFAARFTPIIDRSCFSFSPFRPLARLKSQHDDARENDSANAKAALVTLTILPPERLLDHQGTQMLNRKMSDIYLKAHPSSLRTRFLLCESDFTFVVGERFSGISLPTLMAHRGSLDPRDALELIGQIDRALTHFESFDFGMHDFSPWQIDLYFEDVPPDELKKCLSRAPLANWPAWDVKIRVEKPTESFIESACSPWRYLYDRLDQKTFPALILWLTESDRFDWALTIGNEDREPFSWNPQINSLMDSAIQFFAPEEPKHRKRMLDLLHKIFEKEIRPEP